jgi:probable selenium-dependent hydroxylase accessory protein YqeC
MLFRYASCPYAMMGFQMDSNQKIVYSIIKKYVEGTRKKGEEPHSLIESLDLKEREVISLVGAGGKTTLMFRLARELLLAGEKVVTTTTTKIFEPGLGDTKFLLVDSDEARLKQFVLQHIQEYQHITPVRERLESGKLEGISPRLVDDLWNSHVFDKMVVEADGAARRPVKAPREREPVIPSSTTLVVALLGVDGVGATLDEENVFQAERVSRITGIPVGGKMTQEAMAILLTHPEGLFKGAPVSSRRVAFINKVDILGGLAKGKGIAEKVFQRQHPGIERVVLGQVKKEPPVAEVMFTSNERR